MIYTGTSRINPAYTSTGNLGFKTGGFKCSTVKPFNKYGTLDTIHRRLGAPYFHVGTKSVKEANLCRTMTWLWPES